MNFLNIFGFIAFSVLFIYTQGIDVVQNTSGHEIIDGDCSNPIYEERVYYDHVDKAGFPLIVRSETVTYYGNGVIYCITALNQKNEETGGTSNITEGGVGYSYVVIELESFRGHGLEFYTSIYATNNSNANTNARIPAMVQSLIGHN